MTAADKPRADVRFVALFDAFACLPEGNASMSLHGTAAGDAIHAWAAQHGHRVTLEPLYNERQGAWTMLEVRVAGGTITVHLDSVQEQPAVKPSGRFRCGVCKSFSSGPLGAQCPFEHWPVGYAVEIEQPAAEGSV